MFLAGRLHFHHADGTRAAANSDAPSCLVAYGQQNTGVLRDCGLARSSLVDGGAELEPPRTSAGAMYAPSTSPPPRTSSSMTNMSPAAEAAQKAARRANGQFGNQQHSEPASVDDQIFWSVAMQGTSEADFAENLIQTDRDQAVREYWRSAGFGRDPNNALYCDYDASYGYVEIALRRLRIDLTDENRDDEALFRYADALADADHAAAVAELPSTFRVLGALDLPGGFSRVRYRDPRNVEDCDLATLHAPDGRQLEVEVTFDDHNGVESSPSLDA